ncbi:MAG: HAD family hydrolase [Methanomethylovorans sp.]|jgi:putative hydrolase of the HAD superfamily|nr:HAD family hydrolase [Methanomethylovorans sp.]
MKLEISLTASKEDITCIIFDMDNTLFDFVEAKTRACQAIVKHIGYGDAFELFHYFRRPGCGFEDWNNIRDYIYDIGFYSQSLYDECCKIYETEKLRAVNPYPNAISTIIELKKMGFKIAILTDAHSNNAKKRLEKTGFFPLLDAFFCADITGSSKPSHQTFLFALETLNQQPSKTLFVGDSLRRDIEPSKTLGMLTAYAAYGDRNNDIQQLSEKIVPDFVLNNISEVVDLFESVKRE